MHGKLRDSMVIVSVAIPKKLKKYLERKIDFDPEITNQSDLLRKIILEYARDSIPAEDYAEILSEINKTVENRREEADFIKEESQKRGLYTKKKQGDT